MPGPLLIDLSHTSHTRARTGVQRTARALWRELGGLALPVCHDPYERAWRPLENGEIRNLAAEAPSAGRSARWPLDARLRGLMRRWRRRPDPVAAASAAAPPWGFLEPELFSPAVAGAFASAAPAVRGPRAAVFYDAVVLKHPELSPRQTVARFPGYLRELLAFDGIAAISADSREALVSYWRWLGAVNPPPVVAIPLGVDPAPRPPAPSPARAEAPIVLCVGTLEGRKNHLALLEACDRLWEHGTRFKLVVIGAAHAQTGRPALEKIRTLQASGRPLDYKGPAAEEILNAAYAACAFTVYPSIAEGFGLPVAESLSRGKPCVCSRQGALGEIADGGGCIGLDEATPAALAAALGRLLDSPSELAALSETALTRRFRTWSEYTRALTDWMATLPASHAKVR